MTRTRVQVKSASGLIECQRININMWLAICHLNSLFKICSNIIFFKVGRAKSLRWCLFDLWHFSGFPDSPTCSNKSVRCPFRTVFQIIHEFFHSARKIDENCQIEFAVLTNAKHCWPGINLFLCFRKIFWPFRGGVEGFVPCRSQKHSSSTQFTLILVKGEFKCLY